MFCRCIVFSCSLFVLCLYDVCCVCVVCVCLLFFFQAEDGIRDLVRSRGLGDVYKRQGERGVMPGCGSATLTASIGARALLNSASNFSAADEILRLSSPFIFSRDKRAKFASSISVSYTHLRAHETVLDLVCRLLLEKKTKKRKKKKNTHNIHSTITYYYSTSRFRESSAGV